VVPLRLPAEGGMGAALAGDGGGATMSTARPDLGAEIYAWPGLQYHRNGPVYVLPTMRDVDLFKKAGTGTTAVAFMSTSPSAEALAAFKGHSVAVVTGHGTEEMAAGYFIGKQVRHADGKPEIIRTWNMETSVGQQVATPAGVLEIRRAAHKKFGLSDPDDLDPIWRKQAGYQPPGNQTNGKPPGGKGKGHDGGGNPTEDTGELVFESLANVKCKPIKWLVPTIIPAEKSMIIAADGGMGKSTIIRHLAACVSSGRPAFGMNYNPGGPGTVILLAPEDGYEDTVVPHLIVEGADLSKIGHVVIDRAESNGKRNKVHVGLEDIAELAAMIQKRGDVRFIGVDPIISVMSRAGLNDNYGGEVRKVMDPLARLAESTGAAVIVAAHVNKSQTEKAVNKIAGNKQYTNAVRLAYTIDVDPEDEDRRLLLKVKGNLRGVAKALPCFSESVINETDRVTLRNHANIRHLSIPDINELLKDLGRLKFHEPREASADDVMNAGSGGGKRTTRVAECVAWIADFFKSDTVGYAWPDEEMEIACVSAGFTVDNFRKAKGKLRTANTFANRPMGSGGKFANWFGPKGSPMPPLRPESHQSHQAHQSPDSPHPPSAPPSQTEESKESDETKETKEGRDSDGRLKWPKLDDIEAHNHNVDAAKNTLKRKASKGKAKPSPETPPMVSL
jgi:hypothetical protein